MTNTIIEPEVWTYDDRPITVASMTLYTRDQDGQKVPEGGVPGVYVEVENGDTLLLTTQAACELASRLLAAAQEATR